MINAKAISLELGPSVGQNARKGMQTMEQSAGKMLTSMAKAAAAQYSRQSVVETVQKTTLMMDAHVVGMSNPTRRKATDVALVVRWVARVIKITMLACAIKSVVKSIAESVPFATRSKSFFKN